ncbi:MAG: DUF4012 domain-containing protein [Patescibacteria group bacterium]
MQNKNKQQGNNQNNQVPVFLGGHTPSSNIVVQEVILVPQVVPKKTIKKSFAQFSWLTEISTVSLVIGVLWLLSRVAIFLFRLPIVRKETPVRATTRPILAIKKRPPIPSPSLSRPSRKRQYQPAWPRLPKFAPVLSFALCCIIVLAPVWTASRIGTAQAHAETAKSLATGSVTDLMAGAEHLSAGNADLANTSFIAAQKQLHNANALLGGMPQELRTGLAFIPKTDASFSAVSELLSVAETLTSVSIVITGAVAEIQDSGVLGSSESEDIMQSIADATHQLEVATNTLLSLRVDDMPERYQAAWLTLHQSLPTLLAAVRTIDDAVATLTHLSGVNATQRILLIFQNNNELRAGGGFMGSYAVLDVVDGAITNVSFPGGGTYDVQGSLNELVIPPAALSLVANRWEFQDANWWYDWPTSAKKISWFYEHAGGSTVDAVVGIDATFVERLLEVVGPIPMPAYRLTITNENFVSEITDQVEQKYDKTVNKPKQILADLFPVLVANLTNKIQTGDLSLLTIFAEAAQQKHAMIYSRDSSIQTRITSLGWGGVVPTYEKETDSLAIVHTNIAGQKTDGKMLTRVLRDIVIGNDGSITANVSVERTHTGVKGDQYTGVRNVDYLRFYVPLGSQLISATGFGAPDKTLFVPAITGAKADELLNAERKAVIDPSSQTRMYNELGREVFANWLMVDPGQSATVNISYRLPWRLQCASSFLDWFAVKQKEPCQRFYTFAWESQPGSRGVTLEQNIALPGGTISTGKGPATSHYSESLIAESDVQTALTVSIPYNHE